MFGIVLYLCKLGQVLDAVQLLVKRQVLEYFAWCANILVLDEVVDDFLNLFLDAVSIGAEQERLGLLMLVEAVYKAVRVVLALECLVAHVAGALARLGRAVPVLGLHRVHGDVLGAYGTLGFV